MAVGASRIRALALSLERAIEKPHMTRTAFRTPRKIFATLAEDGSDLNLVLDRALQEFYCAQEPAAFTPVPGGWGEMGATRCDLAQVDESTLHGALKAAHALAQPKPRGGKG